MHQQRLQLRYGEEPEENDGEAYTSDDGDSVEENRFLLPLELFWNSINHRNYYR